MRITPPDCPETAWGTIIIYFFLGGGEGIIKIKTGDPFNDVVFLERILFGVSGRDKHWLNRRLSTVASLLPSICL